MRGRVDGGKGGGGRRIIHFLAFVCPLVQGKRGKDEGLRVFSFLVFCVDENLYFGAIDRGHSGVLWTRTWTKLPLCVN